MLYSRGYIVNKLILNIEKFVFASFGNYRKYVSLSITSNINEKNK